MTEEKKPHAEVVIGGGSSVTGEEEGYDSWQAYKEAVEKGEIERIESKPKRKAPKRHDYSFNVDAALDCIDLSFPNYKPSKDAVNFFNIIRLVMGKDPEVESAMVHYFMVDLVFGNITKDMFPYNDEVKENIRVNNKKIAIIAARATAKSTVLTTFMPVYCAITGEMPGFGDVMFWVGFGDSQKAGAKVQANTIRDLCEDSLFCKEHFEKMRFTDEECEFIRRGDGSVKKRCFLFKAKGAAGGSVRGIRYKGERPQILSFDDAIKNEADASSPIIMSKLRSMMYADAEHALGRKGKIILVNTPFSKSDPVYQALEGGTWTPLAIPVCEKIYLGMNKRDYVGSWEGWRSFEDIYEKYEDAYYGDEDGSTMRAFNQELMLRIASEEDKLIQSDMIQWYSTREIEKQLGNYTIVITTDFTASNSKKGDYSGVAAWAINSNDDWFLLDLSLKKMGIEEQYEPLFEMVRRYSKLSGRTVSVAVETNGQQQINFVTLRKIMREKSIFFTFAKQIGKPWGSEGISRAGATKHQHFMRVHPRFQRKKVYFPEELKESKDMQELLGELDYITYEAITSQHDDGLDIISILSLVEYIPPSIDSYVSPSSNKKQIDTEMYPHFRSIGNYSEDPDAWAGY